MKLLSSDDAMDVLEMSKSESLSLGREHVQHVHELCFLENLRKSALESEAQVLCVIHEHDSHVKKTWFLLPADLHMEHDFVVGGGGGGRVRASPP